MPKLYIAESGDETVYEIFDDEVSVGRGAANAVQIHGTGASKMHAVIRRLQGHWKVIDLESKNGTRVNGKFRNQHWLSDGDALLIGSAAVRYAAEGAPQGSPATAAGVAAKPVAAKAAPAKPVAAKPAVAPQPVVRAAPPPVPPASAPTVLVEEDPFAPAPSAAAGAPAVSRSRARRSGGASRGRRGPRDDYDDEYDDDDDMPPPRRNSNSATIVVLGIVGALAFFAIMFAMFAGGASDNQKVFIKADKMADTGRYEDALRYVEQHADPDGDHYWAIVKGIEKWKKLIVAKKRVEFESEARNYYDYEIFRKQAVTGRRRGGFRAKDAYAEEDVARLLREFLLKYQSTSAALMVIGSEQTDLQHLRDCMLENRDPEVKSQRVIVDLGVDHDVDVSARRFGKAYTRLEYLKNAYRLIMTSENYTEFRKAIQIKIDDVLATARVKWDDDKGDFNKALQNGNKAKARKKLGDMQESYGGIPEFATKLTALEQRT